MSEKEEKKEQKKNQPNLNLYQKLIEIRKQVTFLKKDTAGYNFEYTAGSSVIGALRTKMDELGVLLIPELSNIRREGNIIWMDVNYTWVDADSPADKFTIPWFAIGQQKDPSQSFGSALTYAERYFLLKFFVIPTDKDDPDAQSPSDGQKAGYKQKPPKQAPSDKPQQAGNNQFEPITPELIDKIKKACLYAADNNQEQAAKYYHLYADIVKYGVFEKTAPEVERLSLKWAGNVWGKIKKMFEQNGWDIEAALHDFGGDSNAE